MSPYPAQVSAERIADQARRIIETEGIEQLTLAKLAAELGIKAPSLYKHFRSKAELVREINRLTNLALIEALVSADQAVSPDDAHERFFAMCRAYRAFASAHPILYQSAFVRVSDEDLFQPGEFDALAAPMQQRAAALVGEADSLMMLRGAWALVHGFAMLEMSAQFHRAGSVDEAFEGAIRAYAAGWSQPRIT